MLFYIKDIDTKEPKKSLPIDIPIRNLKGDGGYIENSNQIIPLKDLYFRGAKTAEEANILLEVTEIFNRQNVIFFMNFTNPEIDEMERSYFLFPGEGIKFKEYVSNRMLISELQARTLLRPMVEDLVKDNFVIFQINELPLLNNKRVFDILDNKGNKVMENTSISEVIALTINFK